VLDGANLAAIAAPGGGWEVIQFAEAELVAEATWRLGDLLRGVGGTEDLAASAKPAGSRFVLLDEAVVPLLRGVDWVGRASNWRAAPAGRDFADPFATAFSVTATDLALRPRRPIHPRARRGAEGVVLSWIPRSRTDDPFDLEPRLDQPEAWRIEILAAGAAVRTLASGTSEIVYATADEIADFGAAQIRLAVRIAQLSPLTGLGPVREATLDVR
jgi:hypothetical protein